MNIDVSRRRLLAWGAVLPGWRYIGEAGHAAAAAAGPRPKVGTLPPGATAFRSLDPARLADTRPESGVGGFTRHDANTIRVDVAGRAGVPPEATAGVLNVTTANTSGAGFLTVHPAGTVRPEASNVNLERAGQIMANLVTVRLGAGAVDVFAQNPCDLIVDVSGAYSPVDDGVAAGRFVGLASSLRVLDTRDRGTRVAAGETVRVDLAQVVPATAAAVVVNLTVTESVGAGFWTAYPTGRGLPPSSNVNTDAAGQTRANQSVLPIGTSSSGRGINVFASGGGHLIVDVAGYFTGPDDVVSPVGLFVPNSPYRTLDTRTNPRYGRMYPGWVAEFDYGGRALSQAVVVNLTATETRGAGFFTGYAARTERPLASNLNASTANQTIANHAILRTSTVGVAVFTQSGSSLVVDVAGYFTGQPLAATLAAPVNVVPPPPPPAALPYRLSMPRIDAVATVIEGVGSNVVDAGYVGHWPGTGFAGEYSHIVLFGHRTEHGGILRRIHEFVPGDEIVVQSAEGRVFRFGYARRDITGSSPKAIFDAGLAATLPSLSLVACSRLDHLPTDTRYRIVVTFSLLGEDGA